MLCNRLGVLLVLVILHAIPDGGAYAIDCSGKDVIVDGEVVESGDADRCTAAGSIHGANLKVESGGSQLFRAALVAIGPLTQVEKGGILAVIGQAYPNPPAYTASTWVGTGGPPGGLGYDIRMQPNNPDTLLVTDDGAGVFLSTDVPGVTSPVDEWRDRCKQDPHDGSLEV